VSSARMGEMEIEYVLIGVVIGLVAILMSRPGKE
jgi:hypothetical protein